MKISRAVLLTSLILLTSVCLGHVSDAGQTESPLMIPYTGTAPRLDGSLDEAAWKSAVAAPAFNVMAKEPAVDMRTNARLMFDANYLYLAFNCREENIKSLKRRFKYRDDNYVNNEDDCVEVFIDPAASGLNYLHLALNPNNALWDTIHYTDTTNNPEWDGKGIRSAVKVGNDAWTVEMAVPFADIGFKPVANEVWRLNLARQRMTLAKGFYSSSSGLFCRGASFIPVSFALPDKSGSDIKIVCERRGSLDRKGNERKTNKLELTTSGSGEITVSSFSIQGGKKKVLLREKVAVQGTGNKFSFDYSVEGLAGEKVEFLVQDSRGKTLYNQICPVFVSGGSTSRVIENPLYTELLSDEGPGLSAEGMLFWPSSLFVRSYKSFCMRYGIPIDAERSFLELVDHGLIAVNSEVLLGKSYRFPEYSRKLGVRASVWPTSPKSRNANAENWLFLEPWAENYRQSALNMARHGFVWGVFWGDEITEATIKQGVRLYEGRGEKKTQEYMRTVIDKEVREKFGFGKYGMPQSQQDNDPFRWIAWHRYVLNRQRNFFRDLQKEIRQIDPHIRFVSPDCVNELHPFEFSAAADTFDVANHQTGRKNVGLITKYQADLTGKETWPVVHCEHYLMSATPEDVREMYSAVFRNGGTGFTLYPADSTSGATDVGSTEFSSPPRWNAMLELVDRARRQNKVRYPRADCALFFSNNSHQAMNPFKNYSDDEAESLYDLLGPEGAKSWFSFIDEDIILSRKETLSGFKTIFVPLAGYLQPEVVAVLESYVRDGGTLVCFDPQGFSRSIAGAELAAERQNIFGVRVLKSQTSQRWFRIKESALFRDFKEETVIPVFLSGDDFKLDIDAGVQVPAAFADGSPAITLKKLDKGRAIFFAFNPLNQTTVRSQDWQRLMKGICASMGIEPDRDIWRFKFPPFEREIYPPDPDGLCLTNNYLKFQEDIPYYVNNLDTGGTYSYSLSPDSYGGDSGGNASIPFASGDLTDRKAAYADNDKKENPDDWAVGWKKSEAFDLTFDLQKEYPLWMVKLFYSGALPRFSVWGSGDGMAWKKLAEREAEGYTDGVLPAQLTLPAGSYRYVKISFAERREKQEMALVEAEIWGRKGD